MTASSKTRTILYFANRAISHISRLRRLDFSTNSSQRGERNFSPIQRVGAYFEGEAGQVHERHRGYRRLCLPVSSFFSPLASALDLLGFGYRCQVSPDCVFDASLVPGTCLERTRRTSQQVPGERVLNQRAKTRLPDCQCTQ